GGADDSRSRRHQFLGAVDIDPLSLFLAQEGQSAAGTAAAGTIARPRRIDDLASQRCHLPRLVVDAFVTPQITRVVKHDSLLRRAGWKLPSNARQKLAVVLDLERGAELSPIFTDRPHAMRTDREQLLHVTLANMLDVRLGELGKKQIVPQPARRVAIAA